MKKLFALGVVLLIAFEIANVYFIMPMPGSQRMKSVDFAYFLYHWRWVFRVVFALIIARGVVEMWQARGWRRVVTPISLVVLGAVIYVTNVVMTADHIFLAPRTLVMAPASRNHVDSTRLVVGVELAGEARAYPIQFIGYHHQVRDTIAGRPILVTFCTVCRTGRVYAPIVDGHTETFRLVGMDHFNAMFEDLSTHSWWRQATGFAVAGQQKGKSLPELASDQVTLAQWLRLHPSSLVMQPDPTMLSKYSPSFDYESGASRSLLTGTDTASWHDKSWVVGIAQKGASKAFDWNRLRRESVINDVVGGVPIVLALAPDRTSYFAFARPDSLTRFSLTGDSLSAGRVRYSLGGVSPSGASLQRINASQEFWHSWRAFHPETGTY